MRPATDAMLAPCRARSTATEAHHLTGECNCIKAHDLYGESDDPSKMTYSRMAFAWRLPVAVPAGHVAADDNQCTYMTQHVL